VGIYLGIVEDLLHRPIISEVELNKAEAAERRGILHDSHGPNVASREVVHAGHCMAIF
jgi:hypothetical protein